jgi:predicted transcriptional regulator
VTPISKIDIATFGTENDTMARKASTHRFDPDVQAALEHLSKVLHRPKNRLINEAVKLYVWQRSQEMERELTETISALRAYRKKDPDFEDAIADFVSAEVTNADPVEGRPASSQGPVHSEIQRLLHA